MAAEPRNVSGGTGWSRGDIVELVALIIGIPAAIGAVFMLATYYKRRSKGRKDHVREEESGGSNTNWFEDAGRAPAQTVGVTNIAFPRRTLRPSVRRDRMTWLLTRLSRKKARGGVAAEAYEDNLIAKTSAPGIPLARRETELQQRGTEFRDEVDAHVEQERRGWLGELV